jgi:hypothetical protein
VDDLEDKTITVWSKEVVPPAVPVNAPQAPPRWQGIMWGIFPIGSSIVAMALVLIPARQWRKRTAVESSSSDQDLAVERFAS